MFGKVTHLYSIHQDTDAEYLNFRIISQNDLKNATIRDNFAEKHSQCQRDCVHHVCNYDETVTTFTRGFRTFRKSYENRESIIVTSLASNYPVTTNTKVAKVSLLDLIVYITSVLGTWFGLIIIKLTPASIFNFVVSGYKDLRKVAPGGDTINN